MEQHHLQIRGRDISYRTAGEGPAIVLLHGMASTADTWEGVLPALAARARVIAPDLPGHGGSTNPGGDYSLGAHAAAVRDLMVALDVPRATLVGHSYGGGVAMQAAYQFPARVERLVLVGSGGLGRDVALVLRALALPGAGFVLAAGCTRRVAEAGRAVARAIGRVGLRPSPSAIEIGRCYSSLATPAARVALLATLRSVVAHDGQRVSAADRLHLAAEVPTMIVWGERDHIIPVDHARAAHDTIPGSRLEIFPDAGHFPQAHDPDRFARALLGFIDETEAATLDEERMRALMLG